MTKLHTIPEFALAFFLSSLLMSCGRSKPYDVKPGAHDQTHIITNNKDSVVDNEDLTDIVEEYKVLIERAMNERGEEYFRIKNTIIDNYLEAVIERYKSGDYNYVEAAAFFYAQDKLKYLEYLEYYYIVVENSLHLENYKNWTERNSKGMDIEELSVSDRTTITEFFSKGEEWPAVFVTRQLFPYRWEEFFRVVAIEALLKRKPLNGFMKSAVLQHILTCYLFPIGRTPPVFLDNMIDLLLRSGELWKTTAGIACLLSRVRIQGQVDGLEKAFILADKSFFLEVFTRTMSHQIIFDGNLCNSHRDKMVNYLREKLKRDSDSKESQSLESGLKKVSMETYNAVKNAG